MNAAPPPPPPPPPGRGFGPAGPLFRLRERYTYLMEPPEAARAIFHMGAAITFSHRAVHFREQAAALAPGTPAHLQARGNYATAARWQALALLKTLRWRAALQQRVEAERAQRGGG